MKNIYLLKDLSSQTGLSAFTIKYYLKLGLIQEIGRSPMTNFRYFDDSSVKALFRIRRMRKGNASIAQIKSRMRSAG